MNYNEKQIHAELARRQEARQEVIDYLRNTGKLFNFYSKLIFIIVATIFVLLLITIKNYF